MRTPRSTEPPSNPAPMDTRKKRFANARAGYTRPVRSLEQESQMPAGFVHTVGGPYRTKEEAVAAGRSEAQRRTTEHVIHLEDGSIGERNSYGNDPVHRPG